MLKSLLNQPNMLRPKSHEWIAAHMDNSQTYFGHIVFKSTCIDLIIVEHWVPFISHTSITPDSNPPVLQQCFGCEWNQENHNVIHYSKNRHHRYRCTRKLNSNFVVSCTAKKIPNEIAYTLRSSFYELKQQARIVHDNNGSVPNIQSPLPSRSPSPTFSHPANLDPVLKFISSDNVRLKLWEMKCALQNHNLLRFYTDGSLRAAGTLDMKMGLSWLLADPNDPQLKFSASCKLFPSSSRAEVFAVLSALCVTSEYTTVHIHTDSQVTYDGLNIISSDSFPPPDQHNYLI